MVEKAAAAQGGAPLLPLPLPAVVAPRPAGGGNSVTLSRETTVWACLRLCGKTEAGRGRCVDSRSRPTRAPSRTSVSRCVRGLLPPPPPVTAPPARRTGGECPRATPCHRCRSRSTSWVGAGVKARARASAEAATRSTPAGVDSKAEPGLGPEAGAVRAACDVRRATSTLQSPVTSVRGLTEATAQRQETRGGSGRRGRPPPRWY
mmetsp:Transcript_37739/g.93829  ORF Transcript_37739/g.93829 Transcript_37739/m.93829 type:complete len:205 (-) Transcript_37739:721-1335(-)